MASRSKKIEEKMERRQKKFEIERLMRDKHSEDFEVMEEVFDKSTLMVMYGLFNKGVIKQLFGVIKSGKESRIYSGLGAEEEQIAIKIYLTTSSKFKAGIMPYIVGDPRFKIVKRDRRSLIYTWASKEFKNLHKAYNSGIRVPKPIHVEKNILVMEFIGKDTIPAPTLKEKPPKKPAKMYKIILEYIKILYKKAKLVHSDLSEYNIMNLNEEPVIFDMSQSVLIEHPTAEEFLLRDLNVLNRFFKKFGVKVKSSQTLYEWIIKE
jgi:RIO kinase 1